MNSEPRFATLVDMYEQSLSQFGANPLFGLKQGGTWTWVTYGSFGREVERVRAGLQALGVGRGDTVAMVANNCKEWAVTAFAVYTLGAVYVPMYESQHPNEWAFVLRDSQASVLMVAHNGVLDKLLPLLTDLPKLRHGVLLRGECPSGGEATACAWSSYAELLQPAPRVPVTHPAPEDPAILLYTSGTTGQPKGVVLTHRNLASNISGVHALFRLEPSDRSLSFLPWAHAVGQTAELYCLFSMGASLALAESIDTLLENLLEIKPTILFSVPRVFHKLYTAVHKKLAQQSAPIQWLARQGLRLATQQREGRPLSARERMLLAMADRWIFSKVRAQFGGRLKHAFSGGAALGRDVIEFLDAMGIPVYEGYGLTETSPIVSGNCPGYRRIGSVGRPLPGVRVEIDTSVLTSHPSAEGALPEGEIVVYGPLVMQGYFHRPEETAAALMQDGGLRTGDMGYLDDAGYLWITGRLKEQYKLENGRYVVPTVLETKFQLSPYLRSVMVYGENRPYNIALLVLNLDAVCQALHRDLPPPSFAALLQDIAIKGLLLRELESLSGGFKRFERVRKMALLPEDFSIANGLLTPSLKIKRRAVAARYHAILEALYREEGENEGFPSLPVELFPLDVAPEARLLG